MSLRKCIFRHRELRMAFCNSILSWMCCIPTPRRIKATRGLVWEHDQQRGHTATDVAWSELLGVSPWPMLVFTLIGGIGLSTIMAWLRLRSGSVWTAVIFHMALNIHNQGFFENLTTETSWLTHYVSGEHGLMLAIVSAAAAFLFWRRRNSLPASVN